MVLNQQSWYQASFRKWTYQAPEPKSTHQHFAPSSLGSTSRTEWFLPLCGGQSRPNSWQRAVMLWKLWQLKFPSLWLHSVVQDSKKNKRLLPVWVCAFLHPSIPLGLAYIRCSLLSGLAVCRGTARTVFRAGETERERANTEQLL